MNKILIAIFIILLFLVPITVADLPEDGDHYDFVIISPTEFIGDGYGSDLQDLVDWHHEYDWLKGYIIDVNDIYTNPDYFATGPWGDMNINNPYRDETDPDPSLMTEQMFNDNPAKIRNYIRYAHSVLGVEYCLLIGDINDMPSREVFVRGCGAPAGRPDPCEGVGGTIYHRIIVTDMYYGCLDKCWNQDLDENDQDAHSGWGESEFFNNDEIDEIDWEYEVAIGRLPVDNMNELSNIISKIITYMDYRGDEPELYDAILSAGYGGWDGQSEWQMSYAEAIWGQKWYDGEYTTGLPESVYYTQYFDTNPYREKGENFLVSTVSDAIENGVHFINHASHGTPSSWYHENSHEEGDSFTTSDVRNLENDFPLIVFSFVACRCANFDDYDDTVMEAWITEEYGACAVISNTHYGWGSYDSAAHGYNGINASSLYLGSKMIESYMNGESRIGKAFFDSKIAGEHWYLDKNDGTIRWSTLEHILFGSPMMEMKLPTYTYAGPKNELKLTVEDLNGNILPNTKIAVRDIERYTNDNGVVYFYIEDGTYDYAIDGTVAGSIDVSSDMDTVISESALTIVNYILTPGPFIFLLWAIFAVIFWAYPHPLLKRIPPNQIFNMPTRRKLIIIVIISVILLFFLL